MGGKVHATRSGKVPMLIHALTVGGYGMEQVGRQLVEFALSFRLITT